LRVDNLGYLTTKKGWLAAGIYQAALQRIWLTPGGQDLVLIAQVSEVEEIAVK
jgi:hypothetical protein